MWRKLVLFGCFVLMLGLVGASATRGGVVDVKVAAGSDDAEEDAVSGAIDLTSSDLEFIYDNNVNSASDGQVIGIRFVDVQIAKGEVITRAYVRLSPDDIDNNYHFPDAHVLIQGQLDPNPATFEAVKFNVSTRPRTVAAVEWNPGRWLTQHNKDWTSDVSGVIQEIVNQEAWAAGNALVLIISDNASKPSVGMREAESFSGAGTNAGRLPTLYIELGDIAAPDEIYREAESADVMGSSWRQYNSLASLGGKHIGSQNGDGDENSLAPGAAWVAAYNFEAVGGVYKIALRSQKNDSDSFWVRITGATSQTYEHPAQAGTGWVRYNSMDIPANAMGWDVVHSDDNNKDDVYWELPAGPHTIEIAKREDGVLLDCLIITNSLALDLAALPGAGASGLDMRIASGTDDAEQHLNAGMDITSTDLEIPYEDAGTPATDEQVIGLRFTGALINQGGGIGGAYVELEMDSVSKAGSNEPVNVIIEGELSPNAAAFADVATNITDRPVTAAKVKWSMPTGLAVNDKLRSPDISRIIREIANQGGWGPGNALVLIIRDDKDNPSTGLRETESFEGESGAAPLLHLATIVPLAKDPNPANGATGAAFAPPVATYFSSDVPKNIPDCKEVTSSLSVPDSFKIKDLNIEIDIKKTGNNADINPYLKSPDGKQVTLFEDVGFNKDDFKNTILDDEASASIRDGSEPFTGRFKPQGNLRDYDGRDAQGTWTLRIRDDWPGGIGTLNAWRLVVEKPLLISWSPPGGAASQKLYFKDNFEDVNNSAASASKGNLASSVSSYDVGALALGKTYYWRVDGIADDGAVQSTGPIWSFTTAVGNVVTTKRIANGADDVEERLRPDRNGDIDVGSSDLEFPYEDEPKDDLQRVAMRFVGVAVPQGVQIVKSYVEFEVDENRGATVPANVIIDAQLTPDAEPFVDAFMNVSQRTFTTTVVPWSVQNWTAVDVKWQTPDISVLIQEIVNQTDWVLGNALVLTIQDDPCHPSEGSRVAESYEGEAANCPLLFIGAITEAASAPAPADGAVNVPLATVLSWTPGLNAVWRNVYFGTSSSPKLLDATTGRNSAPKLEPSTTYYWKVDEIEANGTVHAGTEWSFTTPPGEATAPNPANSGAGVALDATLSWTAGITAVSHDVYFGTSNPPTFIGNQTVATFDPNTIDPNGLALGVTYYWQVDEIDAQGKKYIGDIWAFRAAVPNAGAKASYYKGKNFEELVLTRTDLQIDFNWGTGAPDPAVGVDNYSVKWIAELEAAFSDTYTLWAQSDDGVRVWLDGALIIDRWVDQSATWRQSEPIPLTAGERHILEMAYYENGGDAVARLHWESPTQPRRAVDVLLLPRFAQNPDPVVGTVLQQKFALLGWTAGETAASHNLYISNSLDDVTAGAAAAFAGNYTTTTLSVGLPGVPVPDGLIPGSTYYWKVDEVEADPSVVHTGVIWSFSVMPEKAHKPSPADGATGVATNAQLSWTAGLAAKLHSVYFGDNLDTVTNAVGAPPLPLTTKNPGPLLPGTTYYWRVDEFNPPTIVKGDVWSFTTAP